MAIASTVLLCEMDNLKGKALVRRFTDELGGRTTLERAAISAQQEQDVLAEEQLGARMRALFQDEHDNDAVFHAVETARLALTKT
ncbi:hypothetical protein BDW02DRAFT_574757 [Decorospora gaudefroyi]|uniref:Uncharacterized protein n=1 Tax=Decorospora gaudefroyi TaxID=184978 RepID=A0A6A5JYK6_9PLEO|nr:hypothetical protein BDW02DRAFT_574757 [Decorospora gaudefroyi]